MLKPEQQSCTCSVCSGACSYKPGWFLPGEAEKAAKFMKMSFQKFFKEYLAVDWWNGPEYGQETFLLTPAIVGHPAGGEYPSMPTGVCVFFQDNRCVIHAAKPFECQMYWHGETGAKTRHKEVAEAWKEHQEDIAKFLKRKPVAPEPTWG